MNRLSASHKAKHITLLLASLVSASPTSVLAWGAIGHQKVGAITDTLLNARARAQVKALIKINVEPAANWADCVKDVRVDASGAHYRPDPRFHASCAVFETKARIKAMESCVARNVDGCGRMAGDDICHKQYHYTDVATTRDRYAVGLIGTSNHDIVGAIGAAIAVLEKRSPTAPVSIANKREALLLLAHLVGDLHQPLHIGAVYLSPAGTVIDPDAAVPPSAAGATRGRNSIDDGTTNLHSEWDDIGARPSAEMLSALITSAKAVPITPGVTSDFATFWASDTLKAAQLAFADVSFAASPTKPNHWTVTFANRGDYFARKQVLRQDQLAKAGARLAGLLNAIWPSDECF